MDVSRAPITTYCVGRQEVRQKFTISHTVNATVAVARKCGEILCTIDAIATGRSLPGSRGGVGAGLVCPGVSGGGAGASICKLNIQTNVIINAARQGMDKMKAACGVNVPVCVMNRAAPASASVCQTTDDEQRGAHRDPTVPLSIRLCHSGVSVSYHCHPQQNDQGAVRETGTHNVLRQKLFDRDTMRGG